MHGRTIGTGAILGRTLARAALAGLAAAALAAPAAAQPPAWAPAHGWRAQQPPPSWMWDPARGAWVDPAAARAQDWRDRRAIERAARRAYEEGYRDAMRQQGWQARTAGWGSDARFDPWAGARPLGRNDVVWRGRDGQLYCRRGDGTQGLVIGAIAGGTLGTIIAGDGQRRLGSIVGGSLGAIIGREIDRGNVRCS